MIKYLISLFLLTLSVTVMAQKKSVVNLIQSKSSERILISGKDVIKVYKGVFQQDFSVMRSDSAYFYVQDNAFDAFGNVNITQGDTLNIFSDKLNYNGNTKIAVLTDNVKMVDKDATLTTNYLTYNTATRIGTYTGGGKLVNKDNTLTSKNGYYFAYSRDSYFRYDVVLVTPDALIKTDTLRYNTNERIAYFLGPTNIYDTKDKKDTLYTENGLYNTVTEQAFFGKKNLYKQGTKRLKGDSLFYDRKIGFGRAVRHVVFTDSEQKITLTGDLANYYKAEERTLVTKDPYVVIVTEQKDTTTRDTVVAIPPAKKDAKTVTKGTSPIKAPSLGAPAKTPVKAPTTSPIKAPPLGTPIRNAAAAKTDTTVKKDTVTKAPERIKRDSIYISADTLETQMVTVKQWREMQEKARLAGIPDTTAKAKKPAVKGAANQKPSKFITQVAPPIYVRDSTAKLLPLLFGKPDTIKKVVKVDKPKPGDTTKLARPGDTSKINPGKTANAAPAKKKVIITEDEDPAFTVTSTVLSDTARIRIVKAYHHAKLFKSDLQAKSDSMFYSYGDSTLKCYVQPLIWTKGSQLSGDTITIQMKNKKMDNLFMFPQAFIVNIEKEDSTHFNQMAGKRMRGFFKNDKLDKMFISGNAESIYFARDSTGKKIDGMERSLSSRMRIAFEDNSPKDIFWLIKPEQRYGPLEKFTEDERILKGFIWKPKERPISKESIIPSYGRKMAAAGKPVVTPPKKGAAGKPSLPLKAGEKVLADTLLKKAAGGLNIKLNADSLSKTPLPAILPKIDSAAVKSLVPRGAQRDTTARKALPVNPKRN